LFKRSEGLPGNRKPLAEKRFFVKGNELSMADKFDYDLMVQQALRFVVKEALKFVERNGLPGNHHFYVTFRTDRSDVEMPDYLRQKHPEEITIVLQHQFWDLHVEENYFRVSLSFNDRQEALKVPYDALVSFMDPSEKFGLQFTPSDGPPLEDYEAMGENDQNDRKAPKTKNKVVTLDNFRKKK